MKKQVKYSFHQVEQCDFCGAPASSFHTIGERFDQAHGMFPGKMTGNSTIIKRCTSCELVFSDPMPIPQQIDDHYGVDPDQFWPESYFELKDDHFQNELDVLLEIAPIQAGKKALDIGAGIGKTMKALDRVGYDSFGIEPSSTFYDMAVNKMNIPKNKLQLQAIENAEFDAEQFQFITFGAVLEHLYYPAESIAKALKWLEPDGLIHIEVPNSNWFSSQLGNWLYKLQGKKLAANLSPMHSPYHLFEFSHRSFQALGKRLGFEIAHHKYHVCETYLPSILDPVVKPYMNATNTGMQLVIWLRKTA